MGSGVQFATTRDGVSIAHRIDGSGPPLVLVRGWLTDLRHHDTMPERVAFFGLLRRHFRLVVYDARGNGLSDRRLDRPPTWDALQLDLEAVMEQIDGPVTLWGSGPGGPIAIRLRGSQPVASSSGSSSTTPSPTVPAWRPARPSAPSVT